MLSRHNFPPIMKNYPSSQPNSETEGSAGRLAGPSRNWPIYGPKMSWNHLLWDRVGQSHNYYMTPPATISRMMFCLSVCLFLGMKNEEKEVCKLDTIIEHTKDWSSVSEAQQIKDQGERTNVRFSYTVYESFQFYSLVWLISFSSPK